MAQRHGGGNRLSAEPGAYLPAPHGPRHPPGAVSHLSDGSGTVAAAAAGKRPRGRGAGAPDSAGVGGLYDASGVLLGETDASLAQLGGALAADAAMQNLPRLPPLEGARSYVSASSTLPRPLATRTGSVMPERGAAHASGSKRIRTTAGLREPPPDPDLLPGIHTSNDVIEYFVRHGHAAEVKLFHCVKANTGDKFCPYDLVVVPREKVGDDYFTISASGVVHVSQQPGNQQSEFTPLGEWMRDQSIFGLMTNMRFFKYYLPQKMFRIWRSTVRHKLYMQVRSKIQRKLFTAKPTFAPSVMELRALVNELSEIPLSTVQSNHLYNIEDFSDQQSSHRSQKATPSIEAVVERVQKILERVSREVVTQERQYRASVEGELGDRTGVALAPGRTTKNRSMVSIKQEKIERARTYKRVVEEAKMLGALIRLADYMLVETLVAMAVSTAEELLALFEAPNKTKGIFLTTVSFTDETIAFTPNTEDVLKVIEGNVMDGMISTIGSVPRLLFMRSFSVFFEEKLTGPMPVDIVQKTPHFTNLRTRLNSSVTTSFENSTTYASMFEDHRPVYEFGKTWDSAAYEREEHGVGQFRKDMLVQKEWRNELDRMRIGQVIGILFVDSRTLRSSLHQITNRTLDSMKNLLLLSAREECAKALNALNERTKALSDRPQNLDDFATFMEEHAATLLTKKQVLSDADVVEEMYDMLTAYEMKVPTSDQVKLDDLHESVEAFKNVLDEGEGFIDERKSTMVSTLDRNITELNDTLLGILAEMHSGSYVMPESEPAAVLEELHAIQATIEQHTNRAAAYRKYQTLFKMAPDDFSNLELTTNELNGRLLVWQSLYDWEENTHAWMNGRVDELNLESVNEFCDDSNRKSYKLTKERKDDRVVFRYREEVEDFKQYLPLLQELANPALGSRHWEQIFKVLDRPYHQDLEFSIQDLIDFKIMDHMEQVETIGSSASKEYSLFKTLEKMLKEWDGLEFRTVPYKESGTFIIGGTDEIQAVLDDQIVKVQGMSASPYVKPFLEQATDLNNVLNQLQDMLDNWLKCQQTWQYLSPIFSSEDIVKQMPEEGSKFSMVDGMWREMMEKTVEAPLCIPIGRDKERLEKLVECNVLLDAIQKGLAAYLEKKRLFFPRFFFLSNDEMLEILSETKDPTRVQPHLRKCFEGIDKLQFTDDLKITAQISVEKELVPFRTVIDTVAAKGAVEKWLLQTESAMLESVQVETMKSVEAYKEKPREEWVLEWPGMVVLVVTAIYWTIETTNACNGGEDVLKEHESKCTEQLMNIVSLVRGDLSKLERATLSALVVMDVHARDVVTNLIRDGCTSDRDFGWQSQLRTSWEEGPEGCADACEGWTCMLRMMSAELEYGYEYLGNSSRLVITPLTDRCYRTLMGAIHMIMGGAPEGPAGTGKTETTKDLAKALARQCVVFNCSDSLDYLAMAKFFKGLASAGAWACFDEFNRIDLEVLSVVAQQVLDIQRAVAAKVRTFVFEGTEMSIKYSAWCSITMNPGYAGRSELPDNLKALFRTVAMMVPDYAMIAEILLYSNGYLQARESARKIVQCYKLCSEQLSSQDHYDYGMRAVIAVLRAAGNLKRRFPDEDEFVLMLRSIVDVNLCKFLSQDVPLFQGIVGDLFPGVVLPEPDYKDLEEGMELMCEQLNLQKTDYFKEKTIQLFEMIVVRHGLMIVGLPFSGKTSSYRVLAGALKFMKETKNIDAAKVERTEYHVINPKSITMGQLYGEFDDVTHEWSDGILAVTFRACSVKINENNDNQWLLLDGPVDAIWIENMNTVLDDNKKLCLNSGEIIAMSSAMSMVFEVNDLAVASPATVSRCGMVYLEPHKLGWEPLARSWVSGRPAPNPMPCQSLPSLPTTLPEAVREHAYSLMAWVLPPLLYFVRRELKEIAPTQDTNLAVTLMRMINAQIDKWQPTEEKPELDKDWTPEKLTQHLEYLFMISATWAIGGSLASQQHREKFDVMLRMILNREDLAQDYAEKLPPAEKIPTLTATIFPSDDSGNTCFEYAFDWENVNWRTWDSLIDMTPIPQDAEYRTIIIPTVETVRYTWLLDIAVQHRYPMLFVGPTGTGKSVYISKHLMTGLPKTEDGQDMYVPNFVGFSAKTSANLAQYLIDARLDKRRKGVYGPPVGKRMVVFVDDLNMPQVETYGAQPPIELLRQFMDHSGWYDCTDNTFRTLQDVQFVAAMGPPGGGRNNITGRYARHFNVVSLVEFTPKTMAGIFSSILDWYLSTGGFPDDIKALKMHVIEATQEVYATAIDKLLPTPSKSHYTFNLRDFSRVIQGITLQQQEGLFTGKGGRGEHIRLWVHEVLRVFYDRLVDDADRSWMLGFVKELTGKYFKEDFNKLFEHLDTGNGQISTEDLRRCFFGDYMSDLLPGDPKRVYDEVLDVPALLLRMEEYLTDYNGLSKSPMSLAIFLYAAEHVSRICRVLKQPGAHMMLAGVGGSGRQSLTKLAASISGYETFQIAVSKSYTNEEWREDLKRIMRKAGEAGVGVVFCFSDTQIKSESFVEDINSLLNAGEVPNLFPFDEKASITENVRVVAKKAGRRDISEGGPAEVWAYFIEIVRKNLHVVLCFSPIGEAFRERLRSFPSLVSCTTIDWFQEWPTDALEAVANKFLKEVKLEEGQQPKLVDLCKSIHKSVSTLSTRFKAEMGRINYVTPTSYLELLTLFASMLAEKRNEVMSAKKRYEVGLEKLDFTAKQVSIMQDELTALRPDLIKTVEETEALMATVTNEKENVVEPKKAIVDAEVAEANKAGAAAKAIKDECEEALGEAIPILNAALEALDTLKPADIKLVQSFKSPPAAVKLVMEAVCVILDVKPQKVPDPNGGPKKVDDYWGPSKTILMDTNFINRLKDYDKDNIPVKIIERIRKEYTAREDFTPQVAAKASSAAEGLCKWVCAMDSYDKVAKIVAPKKAALAEAEGEYNTVMAGLKIKQDELQGLMDKLAGLEQQLKDSMAKKEQLEADVELCSQKLERAEKLIDGLGGEKDRWTASAQELGVKYTNLTGDMLVSAAMVGYLGAFTMPYREHAATGWVAELRGAGIPASPKFELQSTLGDPVKIRDWNIAGLPNDSFSVDNGIMVANARRYPLMIDPQGQANKWVKNMEKANNLQTVKLTDGDYLRTLENAIQFGLPVLIENVLEELDPSLEPLLLKQIFKAGGVNCIKLGESIIEFSDQFRFYITTVLANPHYLPETAVKVTLTMFAITHDGLADQLLGVVVAEERPDLEEQRQELIITSADNKRRLKEIEDRILHVLSSSEGNILEDATAIQILSEAKVVSDEIAEKQKSAEVTEREIEEARVGYRPAGAYNAVLFFCIRDLSNIDPMYQYSLAWFIRLFVRAIHDSEKTEDLGDRLKNINSFFTYSLYMNVCRSLFERHKLLYSFLLCTRIMESEGTLVEVEYKMLTTGGVGLSEVESDNPAPGWISKRSWEEVCRAASNIPNFKNLAKSFHKYLDKWEALYDDALPHKHALPDGYDESLTPFQKLLALRMVRIDKVVPAIQEYVIQEMGQRFIEPPPFDLPSSFSEASCIAPLLFVLSPGSDPTAALLQFAEEKGYGSKLSKLSMGQGQGPKAAAMIEEARGSGGWVLLQNCHLAASWMPTLEKMCESTKLDNTDPEYRLWLTSYPSPKFPISILQNAVKMTNEPPAGIRANLKRSYNLDPISNDEGFYETCTKPFEFKRMLFGLAFLHAFVQERRGFGPIGWNIPYGFDDGDLRISARQLKMYIDDNELVPFDALKYATGECNYGGRVTDDKDRRLLNTILDLLYTPDIMEEGYKFTEGGLYHADMTVGSREETLNYINDLPIVALPEAFGLHGNADITKDNAATNNFNETILLTAGSSGGGGGGQEAAVAAIAKDFVQRLPADFDLDRANNRYPVDYYESMNQVLCQEMLRYNRLLGIIRNSLINLEKAIAGLIVMSGELEGVFKSFAIGQVPALWKGKSFPCLKPLMGYFDELLARLGMLQTWYEEGKPSVFWISGFFFTPSFTTAATQNFARKNKIPIDTVGFDFEFLDVDRTLYPKGPDDGIYVYGFFIEGCAWSNEEKILVESQPKVLFVDAPCIWMVPKKTDEFVDYPHYECPCYRTADRRGVLATTGHSTNFLMMIRIPTDKPAHHWTLRGVCFLTSLPE